MGPLVKVHIHRSISVVNQVWRAMHTNLGLHKVVTQLQLGLERRLRHVDIGAQKAGVANLCTWM